MFTCGCGRELVPNSAMGDLFQSTLRSAVCSSTALTWPQKAEEER